jgi:PAS domain S-box-containing protein
VAHTAALLGTAVVYVVAGKLGLHFASLHASATPVWPPAGIALAAAILLGPRVGPAIFAGAFVVNITTAGSIATCLGISLGNTLEALIAAGLVHRFAGGAAVFERTRSIFAFAVLAGLGSAVSASIGVTSLVLSGYAQWPDVGAVSLTWWLGDAAGDLIVAPVIVLWAREPRPGVLRDRPLEALLLLASVLAIGAAVFGGVVPSNVQRYPVDFLCIPALLWAAFRFGPRETSTTTLLLSAIAVAGTMSGSGPFARTTANESLLLLQAFMATTAVTVLAVATLVWERRRAEDAQRIREQQLRLTLDAAHMGTWEWTIDTGHVTWSTGLERIHGLPEGTFAGTYEAFQVDVHPEDRARLDAAVRAALESGRHLVSYRIVRPDGSVRWVEAKGEVFSDDQGRPIRMLGVCADVTDRREAEEDRSRLLGQEHAARMRAEEAERRLEVLGETARSITASLDLDTVLQRIAEGAKAVCRSDMAAIFLREAGADEMVPRNRVGPWLRSYERLRVRRGEGFGGEVMLTGKPARTADYHGDRRALEKFSAVAEESKLLALMVVPIIIGPEVAGLLYLTNHTRTKFTDEDETICVRFAEQAAIAIQNARSFAREETSRAEAEAANRAKDTFLAMLGHELRNPLGAISSAVQVLGHPAAGDEEIGPARDVIERQARHLGRIVDDLLDVSRAVSGKIALQRDAVDVADVVQRALRLLGNTGSTEAHRISVDAASVWILGDAVRMEQVVTNLMHNALKYTPPGGTIDLAVRAENGMAVLSVRDSGVGIPAALLPRVFDVFVQGDHSLDRTAGGLGIGLTLVRGIVELHGGTVEATSEGLGKGSCFTVRLPAMGPVSSPAPKAPSVPSGPARRILVVEDNDDAREMLCRMLRLLGHEVHDAADGASGADAAIRLAPELVLVDIGLPGIDGYEVARRIRNTPAGAALHLIAVTGYGLPEDRERTRAAGYDDHLVKPIDPERLAALLEGGRRG